MSLLVTSCTMGKQPDKLLHKGPAYLKTRTNISLFGQSRKSAVELLAASRSQFYVKSPVVELDQHQDLAVTDGQNQRFSSRLSKQKEPTRSKSEFDLTQILLSKAEDENDENNNDTSNDSFDLPDGLTGVPKGLVVGSSGFESAGSPLPKPPPPAAGSSSWKEEVASVSLEQPKILESTPYVSVAGAVRGKTDVPSAKPVPLPRKLLEKPVPPPRKHRLSSVIFPDKAISVEQPSVDPAIEVRSFKVDASPQVKTLIKPAIPKKPVLTGSISKPGNHIGLCVQGVSSLSPSSTTAHEQGTFTATPIFIKSPDSQNFQAKSVFISDVSVHLSQRPAASSSDDLPEDRSQRSQVLTKHHKNSSSSDSSGSRNRTKKLQSHSPPSHRLEMSVESASQAVYESGISVVPLASMEADIEQSEDREIREVTRANSSLGGLLEQSDHSPLSLSPTHFSSSVPRSHSDISCRLESQHSRDSSIVSSHSRLSRASVGADLENFFNQMGLEKGVLEPVSRLRELQTSELFDSMSSLDSHDAASICSTYSRSDQEWSESQSVDRSHQQTSIIERNARIIKWLCNVRKAKNPTSKAESSVRTKD